ncbi:CAP-Gly domain-containing linker protein 1 [Uranotaenia lowii]|uniref:CAP-Gly domain-containing linker protein 1 n=1 Tax=Uranotaenia lowii TaxID=190385 RepID=UPI002479B4A5|nr:CAP-Gly domain-containing linker protein 1 [Uranotaenia lowii]
MSDSDDTDILLLIPPDFFNLETSAGTPFPNSEFSGALGPYQRGQPRTLEIFDSRDSFSFNDSLGINSYRSTLQTMSGKSHEYRPSGPTGFSHQSCPGGDYFYSTPNKPQHITSTAHPRNELLNEIDQFLQVDKTPANGPKSPQHSLIDMNNVSVHDYPSLTASDFNSLNRGVPQKPPRHASDQPLSIGSGSSSAFLRPPGVGIQERQQQLRAPLLSLSEIWNANAVNQDSSKVQEERLRRQHCERNIHLLQARLLEYEQKIAVAIDVDKEKEAIILRLEKESLRLNRKIHEMETKANEEHEKLLQENLEIKNKNLFHEKELAETITLVRKLQDKNETLESKVEHLTTANRDVSEVHKNQMRDLEVRFTNSRESERALKDQLAKLRKSFDAVKEQLEGERKKCEDFNKLRAEYASLKVKTDNLSRKLTEANSQNESYRKQNDDLKNQIENSSEEKNNLLKELDVQRLSLKKYYQSQLEDVVADKLKEFQKQLCSVEEQLKSEARKKERTLAERAIKQIELINQTNEQEIKLLNEKYNEQEALYRLQLTNSTKTIFELEEKLAAYQNRRADIAEKLHSIMEVQWQKALEVLTSPAVKDNETPQPINRFNRLSVDHLDKDQLDGVRSLKSVAENETFQTPVSSRRQQFNNNLSDPKSGFPRDLLHNYIELLLEKSPSDLKDLESVLTGCKKNTKDRSTGLEDRQRNFSTTVGSGSVSQLGQVNKTTLGKTPKPWK